MLWVVGGDLPPVVETDFDTAAGSIRVIDFMPPQVSFSVGQACFRATPF
jgi:hypothetical protein